MNRPSPQDQDGLTSVVTCRAAELQLSEVEARRTLALRLAVELRHSESRDITAGYVTRTAQAFEAYLRDGTAER